MTPDIRAVALPERTRSLRRPRVRKNRCCLIYNCPFLGCRAHPHAIPASASPSKPIRPHVCESAKDCRLASNRSGSFDLKRLRSAFARAKPARRSARSVFSVIHAPGKNRFCFYSAPAGAGSVPRSGAAYFAHGGKVGKTPLETKVSRLPFLRGVS